GTREPVHARGVGQEAMQRFGVSSRRRAEAEPVRGETERLPGHEVVRHAGDASRSLPASSVRPNEKHSPECNLLSRSGARIRSCDLRFMSPTSYRTAPPRVGLQILALTVYRCDP